MPPSCSSPLQRRVHPSCCRGYGSFRSKLILSSRRGRGSGITAVWPSCCPGSARPQWSACTGSTVGESPPSCQRCTAARAERAKSSFPVWILKSEWKFECVNNGHDNMITAGWISLSLIKEVKRVWHPENSSDGLDLLVNLRFHTWQRSSAAVNKPGRRGWQTV